MFRQWHAPFLTAVLLPLTLASAIAGPNGATVAAGSATVQGQGTASVVVNQTSQSAIINWQTFNIGTGETTKIVMPGANSTELDRVTGAQGPSQIFGSLSSNGQVFLVNPDGILFGKGSQINVGGLLATTNDIANRDFMARRYNFFIPGNPNASIVNEGHITAQTGGFAALVAPGVRNTGTITATLGKIGLASANSFALDFYGDRLIQLNVNDSIAGSVIDVSTGQPLKSLVSNEGTLKANGGRVELTAVAARQVVDSVINNSGVVEANTIGTHNGMIVLEGATGESKPASAPTQTVKVSGTLSAAGKRKGTTGGTVEVTGENVELSGANINASGRAAVEQCLLAGIGVAEIRIPPSCPTRAPSCNRMRCRPQRLFQLMLRLHQCVGTKYRQRWQSHRLVGRGDDVLRDHFREGWSTIGEWRVRRNVGTPTELQRHR
jgi:filamentous hemagglutinin family protein